MKTLAVSLLLTFSITAYAQFPKKIQEKVVYPVFDQSPWMGVIQTDVQGMEYDKKLDYRIVIDAYDDIRDSLRIHGPLSEAARTYNLNVHYGVPQDKLSMTIVVHAGAIHAILNNEAYRKMYGEDNPNLELLEALHEEGVEIYVCGQSMAFMGIPQEDLTETVKVALSARTTFISLDQQGYSYINVNQD